MSESEPKSYCYGLPLSVGAVTPFFTFLAAEVAAGNYSVGGIVIDALKQTVGLLLATAAGIIPFVLLSLLLYVVRGGPPRVSHLVCMVGIISVAGLTAAGNFSFWYPKYAGEQVSSTAPLVFVFVPFYGCMAAVAAFLIGMAASFIPWFSREVVPRAR